MTDAPPTEAGTPPPATPPAPPADTPPAPPPDRADRLPGRVTAAALILLVMGTLSALGSAVTILWSLVLMGRMGGFDRFDGGFGGFGGFGGTGFLAGVMAVALAAAVAGGHLAAGWGILQRLEWGRVLGLVVSGVALVLIVLGIIGTAAWAAILPDFRELDRVPEWFTSWVRGAMTAGVTIGILVGLAAAVAYGFVLVVLARADDVFDRGSSPT
jgi:hypothetical protein